MWSSCASFQAERVGRWWEGTTRIASPLPAPTRRGYGQVYITRDERTFAGGAVPHIARGAIDGRYKMSIRHAPGGRTPRRLVPVRNRSRAMAGVTYREGGAI